MVVSLVIWGGGGGRDIRVAVEGLVDDGEGDFGLCLYAAEGFRLNVFRKERFDLVVELGAEGVERGGCVRGRGGVSMAGDLLGAGVVFGGDVIIGGGGSGSQRSLCHDETTHLVPRRQEMVRIYTGFF